MEKHGLITPFSSQEMDFDCIDDDEPETVDWLDTDVSEDDDFLPPEYDRQKATVKKRSRALSAQDQQLVRRRLEEQVKESLSQTEQVRQAVDAAVDNGADYVDLSHMGLTEIPEEIKELQHVTVLRKDRIQNTSLKLYLYANDLVRLPPYLFMLKNLSVLSLRHNKLAVLPPQIALLQNLVELSLGNNLLEHLPAEILTLPYLTTVSVCPNPFLSPPADGTNFQQHVRPVPSLVEIASRMVLTSNTPATVMDTSIPCEIKRRLADVSVADKCYSCHQPFSTPCVDRVSWRDFFGAIVPLRFRFCSLHCASLSSH
ncbi:hypothetical protein BCR43DRAFT_482218 [Syncephalastrum racemosum]|uniref:Uncharacterized protein n=1 Tax=Syncephalastrum racemosum TaxID=13706 RepID=A0A1X2HTB7_SYNRA|nr:hypothetical protein BCR43DRAFT_482218 [Syncephalastrum racemosum]